MSKKNDFTNRFKRPAKPIKPVEASESQAKKELQQESSRNLETNKETNEEKEGNNKSLNQLEVSSIREKLTLILESLNNVTDESLKEVKKGVKRRSFDLPDKVVSRLKLEAAISGKYMNDILVEALGSWFQQHGKAPEQLIDLMGDNNK